MIARKITTKILKLLKEFPVVVILGPRQVGKTTLVKSLVKSIRKKSRYIDLERSSDYAVVNRDAETYLEAYTDLCVVIDEVQRMSELFPLIRSLVDDKRIAGRFILTGSASPALLKGASESLAGRVYYFYLEPIGLHELPPKISLKKHWLRGGFPKALTLRKDDLSNAWLDSFVATYIERDLPFLFDVKFSPIVMRKLWSMLAYQHGTMLNAENLGSSLGITGTTVKRYLDFLEGAFLVRRLPPFFTNGTKRLVKTPKVYINDSGILHFLLRITSESELMNHPSAGPSWEGYVISQIIYTAENRIDAYYYRTHAGAECDLVLVRGSKVVACIEIKLSKSPSPPKGFYNSIEDLGSEKNFVIGFGNPDYIDKNGVRFTDLKTFIGKYLPRL